MLWLTWLGSFRTLTVLCSAMTLSLLIGARRWEAAYLVACAVGAGVCCTLLKLLFRRARPDAALRYLVAEPESFSFPSGHSFGAAGVLGPLVLLVFAVRARVGWRISASLLGASLVLGVAASRVYLGVHYPSDVVGGFLAAAAWVAAVTGWFYPRLLPAEAVEPSSARDRRVSGERATASGSPRPK
jgi:undecaprenyl-diphosphatase